ncbi:MAG: hypothetical protein JOZ75_09590, partial [Candidatus Dormibacteraeota bacterium]|nr:hypothetical protein [Candidatus Dormibacteraeota bacterium]
MSRLGELLIQQGGATADVINKALKAQRRRDRRKLGEILLDLGVPPSQVNAALGLQFGVTLLDLDDLEPEHAAIDSLDASFVRDHNVFPYRLDEMGRLHVATTDASDETLARAVMEKAQRGVTLELADGLAVQRAIDRHYTMLTNVDAQAAAAIKDARVVVAGVPELAGLGG